MFQTQTKGENLTLIFGAPFDLKSYDVFKNAKRLPEYSLNYDYELDQYFIETHIRYSNILGLEEVKPEVEFLPFPSFFFQHQSEITSIALKAKRFAIWSNVGTGKTNMELEFARQVSHITDGGRVLIFTLNEIVNQTIEESGKFYGDSLQILKLETREEMRQWCKGEFKPEYKIAITNYEKMNPDIEGQEVKELKFLSGIILDESSRLKAGGGKQKWAIIRSSKGIPYKLSATATPAPNDYIEFASQASFLERMRDENEIIWTFFAKDKNTGEWTVKKHAREAFFEWMCGWSIYLKTPQAYGWSSDFVLPPEPEIILHEIEATEKQIELARLYNTNNSQQPSLFVTQTQGVVGRSKLSQIAKGFVYQKGKKQVERVDSFKPQFVAELVLKESSEHQVLVWTIFDEETEILRDALLDYAHYEPNFAVLSGNTPKSQRKEILDGFRSGRIQTLISKASLLGYGMNFQMCGSMIFSGWNDSFEAFYQAIGRTVRYGQTKRVRIHLPFIRSLEFGQLETIFRKRDSFESAIAEQEKAYIKAMKRMKLL